MNRLYIQLAGFFFSVLFLSPCLITYAQNTDNWQLPYDVDGYTVALWHFDESSGNNVTDAGPNNYNGVSTNTNIINSMNGFGNAREFQDDPTGYITFGNFNLPQFEGTLEYWVYPITRPVTPCDHSHFFTKGTHGNSGGGFTFYNRLYNDTDVDYGLGDNGGGEGRYFENAFIYNEWQHIAFTWSTEETKMYVNGELIGIMDPFPNGIGQSSDEVALGKWGSQLYTRCRYLGYVDEVRISSIERTFEPLAALVAYYPFNGNANDESGNGNHGTVNGALLTADRFGSNNSAYSFEGEDDYIELENNIDQTNYFTLSAWVHLNEYNPNPYHSAYGGNTIFARGNLTYSGQWDYIFNVNGNHHLGFVEHRANGGGYTIQADEEFPLNRWVHVVYVYDNGFAYLYQDGEQVAFRDDFQGGNTYQKDPTVIGILYRSDLGYTSEEWTGDLDDFRIYDRALTEAEILDLYHENGWPGGGSITLPFNDEFTGGPDPAWDVIGDYWFFNNDKVYSNVDQTYIYQYMIVGDNSWQDYTFEVDVLGTSGTDKAICFRVQDTQNFYMLHLIGPIQYHHIELYRYVDGQYTVIYQNPNYPVQNNVNYHLKVETYGNIIKIYINGVFEAEVTDDTFDSGRCS